MLFGCEHSMAVLKRNKHNYEPENPGNTEKPDMFVSVIYLTVLLQKDY
jgi:hypothetical protein